MTLSCCVVRDAAEAVLVELQLTTHSALGAVALETGGILVDRGWVRLLGSGSPRLRATLASWNKLEGDVQSLEGAVIVGFDAVAGFFAVNGGAFAGDDGHVFYLAPDTLEWESLERGYSEFLRWMLAGDLGEFYADLRWPGWADEVAESSGDFGFSLYPPPFTKEGKPVASASRALAPMAELWRVQRDFARRLRGQPDGAQLDVRAGER
jgi:hypothetical protein